MACGILMYAVIVWGWLRSKIFKSRTPGSFWSSGPSNQLNEAGMVGDESQDRDGWISSVSWDSGFSCSCRANCSASSSILASQPWTTVNLQFWTGPFSVIKGFKIFLINTCMWFHHGRKTRPRQSYSIQPRDTSLKDMEMLMVQFQNLFLVPLKGENIGSLAPASNSTLTLPHLHSETIQSCVQHI